MRVSGLAELDAVAAVARHRNFRAAADELGLSRSALSHAVAALEQRLGVRLFNRTTRSVSLTEAGAQFIAEVDPALGVIREAMQTAASHRATPAGVLRINASTGAARRLAPVIFEYVRRYPEMKVDLVTEDRFIDIVVEGFDAGVRLAENVPQDMIAVPFGGDERMLVVGSPAYFEDHPPPQNPQDLLRRRCIVMRLPSGRLYRWEFERHGEVFNLDVDGPLILDEGELILEAARSGAGLAYVAEWGVARDLAEGRLVCVLEDWTPPFPGLRLYFPGRRHMPAGLRVLVDLIRETAGRGN